MYLQGASVEEDWINPFPKRARRDPFGKNEFDAGASGWLSR